MDGSGEDDEPSMGEIRSMIRQLESTAHEAHEHLHGEIRDNEREIAEQREIIEEMQDRLAETREELKRVQQKIVILQESDGESDRDD